MHDLFALNPIVYREVVTLSKTKKTLAMQLVLAVVFAVLVMIRWPTDARVDISGDQALEVFRVFAYGLLVALLLFVPAFPAVSIVKEKSKGTLALLFNSPLSPTKIYLGKFLGVFLFAMILVLLSLPAVGAVFVMGGIDAVRDVGGLYLILTLMVAEYIAVGLLISARSSSPDSAMRTTYLAVVALAALTLIPHLFYQGQETSTATIAEWLRCLSPIAAIMELVGQESIGAEGRIEALAVIPRYLLLSSLLTVGFAVATISQLNYRIFDRSRAQGRITDDQSRSVQVARGMLYLVDPQRRKAAIRWVNPVFVKEFRTRRFGRIHWILRLVSLCAIVSVALTFVTASQSEKWGAEKIGGIMAMLQILLILLLIPSTAAGLISSERESGGWTLLQMTPMSTLRIMMGKLLSAVVTVVAILLGTLPGYIVLVWINPELQFEVRQVLISLAFAAVFAVCLSTLVSSLFRRTSLATTTAYGLLIAIFIGTLLFWLGRDAPFGYEVVQRALMLNPVAAALTEMRVPGFEPYRIVPIAWWISGTLSVLCLLGLGIQVTRLTRPS